MFKYFLLCFIGLCCSMLSFAQKDMIDGYIITNSSDTIFGEINNNDYRRNSQYCEFKSSETDEIKKYFPSEILGFRFIGGKYYISDKVDGKLCFLEFLIQGEMDIYFYQDEDNQNHYYASKDTSRLVELLYKEEIRYVDNTPHLYENKAYIGALKYFTYDYPELANDISSLGEPSHKNLIKIAKRYHEKVCPDGSCTIYEKNVPREIKFQIQGGATMFYPDYSDYSDQLYPSGGFQLLFQQTQRNEKLYLGVGFQFEGEIDSATNFYRVPLSINYIHPRNGFSPYFAFDFDLIQPAIAVYKAGLNYKKNKVSAFLVADLKAVLFVMPFGSSLNFGLRFDLR